MENVNFGATGEEIERALMDLGPLLGVSIKEEAPDEAGDTAPPAPAPTNNLGVGDEGGGAGAEGGGEGEGKEGADSLASPPGARHVSPAAARCVVCSVPLTAADGTPKLMECLHSICEPCLKAKIDEKQAGSRDFLGAERITITCPTCRLQCQPSNMIDQRFVIEKMNLEQSGSNGASRAQQCNSCEDTEPATSYCVDCAEFICDNCVNAHQRLKITKDHTIKCKEEAVAELQAAARSAHEMYCREHPAERLSLFCETCDRLTCRDCQLQHHRDHKYQFSSEMAAQARAALAALLAEVSYKRVLLSSAMKVIRDRQHLIADKKKALVHEITQTVVKLTNAINTRGKQLVLRLGEVCDAKQRTLAEKKDALEQLAAITDHCVQFVAGALDAGSDTALLHCKPHLHHHLARIKSRRADIPNPEIPVRITLALDKLPDLVRVLSNVGAIVVDGKVDGGAPAPSPAPAPAPAQGPYHPPPQPQAAPHSAIVALQHHAMHQTMARYQQYVQASGGGGGGAAWGGGARRGPTPLRHAHVSSTTHPHQLHGISEMNLRGLLGARAPRPPQLHAYHHMMNAYAAPAYPAPAASPRRGAGPRTPSPAPPAAPHLPPAYHQHQQHQHHQQQQQHHAKWHIPQHNIPNGGYDAGAMSSSAGGSDFKITLSRPPGASGPSPGAARPPPGPSVVTSTNPKTPSPNLNGGASLELDKVCAESVQDLMATIAKLDSNGVQVLAEPEPPAPSPAPHVHSSTDEHSRGKPAQPAPDPNEDWCAVCMDGGELMCCDKCPKVFHQYCHIPTIEKLPDESESWQCLLCVNFAELGGDGAVHAEGGGLSPRGQRLVERITLELYCQYELSLALREPPGGLDAIRARLQPRAPHRYTHVAQFVRDCRALFRHHQAQPESQTCKEARRLEEFFDAQLVKLLPEYAYWSGEGEPPAKRARQD